MQFVDKLTQYKMFLTKLIDKHLIIDYYHVGSTAVLSDKSLCKDIDFICLVESFKKFKDDLETKTEFNKLKDILHKDVEDYGDLLPLISYRINSKESDLELNLILIENNSFYATYKEITDIQNHYKLNIVDKTDRINFHQIFVKYYYNSIKRALDPDFFAEIREYKKDIENEFSLDDIL